MEKTPFRLLAKVFLTVGGLLAAFLLIYLIYMNATVEIPLQWRGHRNAYSMEILLYSILTLAKQEPVGLVLLLVTQALLLLGLLFCHLSKKNS